MATTNGIDRGRIPLMLIHGAWLSARSWENFADTSTSAPRRV